MFTLYKLAVLIVIIGALLYGARLAARLGTLTRAVIDTTARPARRLPRHSLVACPVCGVYRSSEEAAPCGRGDCPYHGRRA